MCFITLAMYSLLLTFCSTNIMEEMIKQTLGKPKINIYSINLTPLFWNIMSLSQAVKIYNYPLNCWVQRKQWSIELVRDSTLFLNLKAPQCYHYIDSFALLLIELIWECDNFFWLKLIEIMWSTNGYKQDFSSFQNLTISWSLSKPKSFIIHLLVRLHKSFCKIH